MADIALITPGMDGMNLVSKEFIAANREPKVLILSRFAGSSKQLDGALLVNPYDREEIAESIKRALEMSYGEKKRRWKKLRRTVKEEDLPSWAENFITDLEELGRPTYSTPVLSNKDHGEIGQFLNSMNASCS